MSRALLITITIAGGCASTPAVPAASAPSDDGSAAWALLSRALPGSWRLQPATDSTRPPFLVRYRLISNSTALVEEWGVGTSHETETVFYPDHARLLLTHFCAQGNQPRLAAVDHTADAVHFRFVDVTNRAPDQDMLVDRVLRAGSAVDIDETYRTADGRDDVTHYHFVRDAP